MTLTQMTAGGVALGLAALAFGLYLMQRLRVRHDEYLVVTTLFWQSALEEARARTLVERFRHPLAYAFALLCAGLLWFAVAGPDSRRVEGTQHVFLLDGSAGMALDGRFEAATEALQRELAAAPRDRTEVLWCGADVETLLAPGEDRALLDARLASRVPEPVPSSLERALIGRAAMRRELGPKSSVTPRRFVVLGDGPVREAALAPLRGNPQPLRFERAELGGKSTSGPERVAARGLAITALGVAPAASGAFTAVDVYVAVRGGDVAAADVTATIDGATLAGAERVTEQGLDAGESPEAAAHRAWLWRDVPALGGTFEARLAKPSGLVADDQAQIVLPTRRAIRVAFDAGATGVLGPDVSEALRLVLAADTAVELVSAAEAPAVLITTEPRDDVPSLCLRPADEVLEAILVEHDPALESADVLRDALGELGLDRLDGARLASELGRALSVGASPLDVGAASAGRRVTLWRELLAPERTGFLEDRAFPLVIGRAVRWLASTPAVTPYVATGRAVPRRVGEAAPGDVTEVVTLASGRGSLLDSAPFLVAEVAGRAAATEARSSPAGADLARAVALSDGEPQREGPGAWRPLTWILLLATALLAAEWALVNRGRMP